MRKLLKMIPLPTPTPQTMQRTGQVESKTAKYFFYNHNEIFENIDYISSSSCGNKATSSHFIHLARLDQISGCCPLNNTKLSNNDTYFRESESKRSPFFEPAHRECVLINTLSITQSCTSFCCGMKFLRHCRESWPILMEITFIPQECALLCKEGMQHWEGWPGIPKTNCSSKCFFEESGKVSNPITSQLTTLSEDKFQKASTLCSIDLRRTTAMCPGTEINNGCQGQDGASWLNSFIPSPGKMNVQSAAAAGMRSQSFAPAQTLLFYGICFGGWSCWFQPWDKRTNHNRSSSINYSPVNTFWNKCGQSLEPAFT